MPNKDMPLGLRPVRHRNGAPYNAAVNYYLVDAAYATNLFVGDCVTRTGSANTAEVEAPGAGHFKIGTLPTVEKTAAGTGNAITGVIVGVAPDPNGLERTYSPASTQAVIAVCDDPDIIFEAQCSATLAPADVGQNGNLIYTEDGSTQYGTSGTEMSGTTATTAAHQLRFLRFVNRDDNDPEEVNAKVLVMINNHTERAGAGI